MIGTDMEGTVQLSNKMSEILNSLDDACVIDTNSLSESNVAEFVL